MLQQRFPVNASPLPLGERIYAIGDIHGRLDLLDLCLDEIRQDLASFPCERPRRVFLGDYIDRGPASSGVLGRLALLSDGIANTFLSGNHEAYLIDFLDEPSSLKVWSRVGAAETLASYGVPMPFRLGPGEVDAVHAAFVKTLPDLHRRFLATLELTFTAGGFLFVHAGLRPGLPLGEQRREDHLMIREPFLSHPDAFPGFVVHGHTPVDKPEIWPNRLNVDTRAWESGLLTCAVIEGSEVRFLWGCQ